MTEGAGGAAERRRPSVARIRHQPLHGASDLDQSARAGDRRLDPAQTGYEAWHSEPFAFLSANRRTLRVYHTPQMQARVAELVDRFVNTEAESSAFSIRVITIGHPDWRIKAKPMLHSVSVQTQGIQAWLVAKEDAALLLAELRKRQDFREHSSPQLLVNNGQSAVVAATRQKTYTRDITLHPNAWPAYEPELDSSTKDSRSNSSPLLSLDGQTIDAVIKCHIDQLERLMPVMMDVPSQVSPHQRSKIDVPQITHCRLHERFRWPTDQVLLVGWGLSRPRCRPTARRSGCRALVDAGRGPTCW